MRNLVIRQNKQQELQLFHRESKKTFSRFILVRLLQLVFRSAAAASSYLNMSMLLTRGTWMTQKGCRSLLLEPETLIRKPFEKGSSSYLASSSSSFLFFCSNNED